MSNPVLDQERVQLLKARQTKRKRLLPAWPRTEKELPEVEVEVDWVRFSTLNHRTRAEQMRVIHQSEQADLFTADPLGDAAQRAQYKILCEQEKFAALKADLNNRGQQEPAVLTAEGVLVNGNRRAAALRSLLHDDINLHAKYIRCLVLPEDATPAEILDLEAELQVARDFKEDYSWVNEALLIEELYESEDRNYDRVAKKMHRDVGDVRSIHEKLQQVHQLVAISHGARLHVDFTANESAFDELAKHIRNKQKQEADSVRDTYFLGTLANVNYRSLRHLRRSDAAEMVLDEISKDASLVPFMELVNSEELNVESNDPLDAILGEPARSNGLSRVLGFLAAKKLDEVIDFPKGGSAVVGEVFATLNSAINAAADEAEEELRDQTAVTAPVVRAQKAVKELDRALLALPKARGFPDWREADLSSQIEAIQARLAKMRPTG